MFTPKWTKEVPMIQRAKHFLDINIIRTCRVDDRGLCNLCDDQISKDDRYFEGTRNVGAHEECVHHTISTAKALESHKAEVAKQSKQSKKTKLPWKHSEQYEQDQEVQTDSRMLEKELSKEISYREGTEKGWKECAIYYNDIVIPRLLSLITGNPVKSSALSEVEILK